MPTAMDVMLFFRATTMSANCMLTVIYAFANGEIFRNMREYFG